MAAMSAGRQLSTPRAAKPSRAEITWLTRVSASEIARSRGGLDLLLALAIDQPIQPHIERDQRRAGKQRADGNRNDISARNHAHDQTHPGVRQPTILASSSEPHRRKGGLKQTAD